MMRLNCLCAFVLSTLLIFVSGVCFSSQGHLLHRSKALSHYMMGVVYELKGEDKLAIKSYQQSLKFDQRQSQAHLRLASLLVKINQNNKALAHLKLAVKLSPSNNQAHYLLGLLYTYERKHDLATKEYEKALQQSGNDQARIFEIHHYLGEIYYQSHQYEKAAEQFQKVLLIEPNNLKALFQLGAIKFDQNNFKEAERIFKEVLKLYPDHEEALNSLAYLYAQTNIHLLQAKKMVDRAIEINPINGAFYDTLGLILFKQGFNSESLLAFQKATTMVDDPVLFEHLGDVYLKLNDRSLAKLYWSKSLHLKRDQPKLVEKLEQLKKTSANVKTKQELITK